MRQAGLQTTNTEEEETHVYASAPAQNTSMESTSYDFFNCGDTNNYHLVSFLLQLLLSATMFVLV